MPRTYQGLSVFEARELVQLLIGLTLVRVRRAVDMEMLAFQSASADEPRSISNLCVHLQCPWQFREAARVLVSVRDNEYPPDSITWPSEADVVETDSDTTRRDERVLVLIRPLVIAQALRVTAVDVTALGELNIHFDGNRHYEVSPTSDHEGEAWRLFEPKLRRALVVEEQHRAQPRFIGRKPEMPIM